MLNNIFDTLYELERTRKVPLIKNYRFIHEKQIQKIKQFLEAYLSNNAYKTQKTRTEQIDNTNNVIPTQQQEQQITQEKDINYNDFLYKIDQEIETLTKEYKRIDTKHQNSIKPIIDPIENNLDQQINNFKSQKSIVFEPLINNNTQNTQTNIKTNNNINNNINTSHTQNKTMKPKTITHNTKINDDNTSIKDTDNTMHDVLNFNEFIN